MPAPIEPRPRKPTRIGGIMPAGGPETAYAIDKAAGNVTTPVNLSTTYTNSYAAAANKLEGTK